MEYIIRQETEQDHPAIYDLIRTAFETAKVSDGDEQDFAVNLRRRTYAGRSETRQRDGI